jgi:hypothetical protein
MFIVFGSPRSGTTLLKECLNLHSQVFIPMQTTVISTAAHLIGSISDWAKAREVVTEMLLASDDFATIFSQHLSEVDVRNAVASAPPTFAGVIDALYSSLASKLQRSTCGDKSPDDLLSIRKLEQVGLFDSSIKFVHIVRDVRGSVASLLNVNWAPKGIDEYFPRIWSYTNLHVFHALNKNPNYVLLKYEDLVTRPEQELTRITELLGLQFEASMLDASQRGPELRTNQSHVNLAQPFLPDRISAWQGQLPDRVRHHCEFSAREAMLTFGYE